jgi:hypothetical protein
MRSERPWILVGAVLFATFLAVAGPVRVDAQTVAPPVSLMFTWPVDHADYTTYHSPEACLAAARRVQDSLVRVRNLASGARADTMAFVPAQAELPGVVDVVTRCGSRFTLDNTPPESWSALYRISLMRGDDAGAAVILDRQLAHITQTSLPQQAAILNTALDITLDVHPVRAATADGLVARLDTLPDVPVRLRLMAHAAVAQYALTVLDTARLRHHAAAIDRMLDGLTPEVRRDFSVQQLIARMPLYRTVAAAGMLRDSGAVTFTRRLLKSNARASGVPAGSAAQAQAPVGEHAATLEGTFWYHRVGNTPHPAPGKPSLVVFDLRHDCAYNRCASSYAVLRRLGARFGDTLDVTLVAQTQGFFAERRPQQPAQEAEAIRHYVFDQLHLPGTLVVEQTAFTVRPDPDGRRFNAATANQRAYHRQALDRYASPPYTLPVYVVASDGTIVYATPPQNGLSPEIERGITAIIEALLAPEPHD